MSKKTTNKPRDVSSVKAGIIMSKQISKRNYDY